MKRSEQDVRHLTPSGEFTEKKGSYTDFMCDCREDGKERCLKVVADVCGDLSCKQEELVTCVVAGLTWGLPNEHSGSITGIAMDMWFGVRAEIQKYEGETDSGEPIKFFIQCDKVEYGFARLWQMAKEVTETGGTDENGDGAGSTGVAA